jgi:hypothetical protein
MQIDHCDHYFFDAREANEIIMLYDQIFQTSLSDL